MDIAELSAQVEQVSTGYAESLGIERDGTWFLLKLQEEVGELTQAHLMACGQARGKGRTAEQIRVGFHAEMADVLCHVLLLARHHGVDLEHEVREKWLRRLA